MNPVAPALQRRGRMIEAEGPCGGRHDVCRVDTQADGELELARRPPLPQNPEQLLDTLRKRGRVEPLRHTTRAQDSVEVVLARLLRKRLHDGEAGHVRR